MNNENLVRVTGIWIKKGKKGLFFYLNIGDKTYVAFQNKAKIQGSSKPDFVLYEDKEAVVEEPSDSELMGQLYDTMYAKAHSEE